jgi:hypothetical protein
MSNLYRGPSIDLSYQVSVHLPNRFQRRRFFRNRPIRNKNCLWRPCLLMNRHEISNLYRGLSIDASYQVSFHLVMRFQKRRFETRISCGGHVWKRIGTKWAIIIEDLHRCFLPSVVSFGHAVSEEKIWNKNCLWPPCLKTDRDEMSNLYREILRTKFRFIWPRGFRGED